jgi:hypothetical protein
MFTSANAGRKNHTSAGLGRRVVAMAAGVALIGAVAGNAAAYQLRRDDAIKAPLVTPRLDRQTGLGRHLQLKLRTTTGRSILIYG